MIIKLVLIRYNTYILMGTRDLYRCSILDYICVCHSFVFSCISFCIVHHRLWSIIDYILSFDPYDHNDILHSFVCCTVGKLQYDICLRTYADSPVDRMLIFFYNFRYKVELDLYNFFVDRMVMSFCRMDTFLPLLVTTYNRHILPHDTAICTYDFYISMVYYKYGNRNSVIIRYFPLCMVRFSYHVRNSIFVRFLSRIRCKHPNGIYVRNYAYYNSVLYRIVDHIRGRFFDCIEAFFAFFHSHMYALPSHCKMDTVLDDIVECMDDHMSLLYHN